MNVSEFLRLYPMRVPQIMWFLGAGASAAAGVPTAYNMIWEFKRAIYCSRQRVPLSACADLSNPLLLARIQAHFDSLANVPAKDDPDEYSYYFDQAYPNEADRRRYIEQAVSRAAPSFGHFALASLLKMDKVRAVWTTNFDRMVEDSAVRVFDTSSRLVVANTDVPNFAAQAFSEARWPIHIKLHGDFHSRRLKNTSDELRSQDAELRDCLMTTCRTQGLAVVGYSGRDSSVMDTLEEAIADGRGFPAGLLWFHRSESPCLPRVNTLIESANARGVDAHLVEVETFDELMADILSLMPNIPVEIADMLEARPRRVSNAPSLASAGAWPILRTNAFPIVSAPTVCRRIVCNIRGSKEVRQAVAEAGAKVLVARRNVGVIAFGDDSELRRTFEPFNISEISIHSIEQRRLKYESAELGLLYDAICEAIAHNCPVIVHRRGRRGIVAADLAQSTNPRYGVLRSAVSSLGGNVPDTQLAWSEAARIRLENRLDRLWLIVEPTIWVAECDDERVTPVIKDFIRERLASRYNATWNRVLDGWAELFVGSADSAELRAFGIGSGIDAVFKLCKTPGFSWRGGVR